MKHGPFLVLKCNQAGFHTLTMASNYLITMLLKHNALQKLLLSTFLFWYGSLQIARRLLGKILIDLRNTREEAISVAELKANQDKSSMPSNPRKEETEHQPRPLNKIEDTRRSSFTSEKSIDQDDDDDKEIKYRLDPK